MYKVLGSLFGLIVFIYMFFQLDLSPISEKIYILGILAMLFALYDNVKKFYAQSKS